MLSCLFCTLFWKTQPSHTAFFWEPKFLCTGSQLFFLAFGGMCFWQQFLFFTIRQCSKYWRFHLVICQHLCDKLQTASVSRGQIFTGVSNLITAQNREKTSKCNLTGCKATGHPLRFYGIGQGGSSEAK